MSSRVLDMHKFVDLCSKALKLFVEVKWISQKGPWRRIVEQIHVDTQTYIAHPACDCLYFAIVDAARAIPDPQSLEHELSGPQTIGDRTIKISVIVINT